MTRMAGATWGDRWGAGNLNADDIASKYNLDRSKEGRGENDIWATNADGKDVYLGRASMDLASNPDLIAAHSRQAHPDEVNHSGANEKLSSIGDIRGALFNLYDQGSVSAAKDNDVKPTSNLSPQLEQAIDYVGNYENELPYTGTNIFGDRNEYYGYSKQEIPEYVASENPYRTNLDFDRNAESALSDDDKDDDVAKVFNNQYKLKLASNLMPGTAFNTTA